MRIREHAYLFEEEIFDYGGFLAAAEWHLVRTARTDFVHILAN
jgi:hypothetical protein